MASCRQVDLSLPPTSLIGREREIADLHSLLSRPAARLVTLTGAGGAGKTRLALRVASDVAARFPDGLGFVSLAPIRASELVVSAIAQSLGIPEPTRDTVLDHLIASLASKQFLLVLDNFEQVLDAGPAVAQLLRACSSLKVLVTSRVVLGVSGEHEYAVPPMPFPDEAGAWTSEQIARFDAVQLFIERAQAVQARFELTPSNASDVARICARLDGLPLAIELAAARVKMFPPYALLKRLDRTLPLLTGGPRDAPPRLRTMRNAIAWSYDLLDEHGRCLFQRLAVFVNGFTLDAAVRVADPDGTGSLAVLNGIASLVDQSLVLPVPASPDASADGEAAEPRFTMLETIREFALEGLASSGEEQAVRRAHAEYFRELAERAEPELRGARQTIWLRRLETEIENLRAVLDWSLTSGAVETGLRLAGALYWFWFLRNHFSEGRDWFERARVTGTGTAARAKAAMGAGLLASRAGDYAESDARTREALELFAALDDRWGIAFAVHHLAHLADELHHDSARSVDTFRDSLERFREIGDAWGIAFSERCMGRAWVALGEFDQGIPLLEDALATFRTLGDQWCISTSLHYLGDVARLQGRLDDAIQYYQESLADSWAQRDALGVADALLRLGQILVERGDAVPAARLFGAAEVQHETAGIPLYGPIQAGYEQAVATARAALGNERFTVAWHEGRALPLEEAAREAVTIQRSPHRQTEALAQWSGPAPGATLSARECDVLRLIVDGLTDAEIAATLSIGRRTVNTHVTSILNKLGVKSRTAAAAWAVRSNLV